MLAVAPETVNVSIAIDPFFPGKYCGETAVGVKFPPSETSCTELIDPLKNDAERTPAIGQARGTETRTLEALKA